MYGSNASAGQGQAIFTDDVSLQVFMEHLKRLVRRSITTFRALALIPNLCILLIHHRRLARKRIDDQTRVPFNSFLRPFVAYSFYVYNRLFRKSAFVVLVRLVVLVDGGAIPTLFLVLFALEVYVFRMKSFIHILSILSTILADNYLEVSNHIQHLDTNRTHTTNPNRVWYSTL